MFLRHLAAFLALPFVAAFLVPAGIAWHKGVAPAWPSDARAALLAGFAVVVLAAGLTLFVSSVHQFVVRGRGTLAPWDPPQRLVVAGPYRYVRNPMISGVLLILIAEALFLRTQAHALWALGFAIVNAIYIPLVEEPQLARRFGDDYRLYCRHVRRLMPRLTAWVQPDLRGGLER